MMPAAPTSTLSAPLHRLLALVGHGQVQQQRAELSGIQQQLDEVAAAIARSGDRAAGSWAGTGATSAADYVHRTVTSTRELAARIGALAQELGVAADAIARVRAELERLIADFEVRAAALEAEVKSERPGAAEELADETRRAQTAAQQLVDDLRTELAGNSQNVTAAPPPPVSTAPAGFSTASPGAGSVPARGLGGGMGPGTGSGLGSGLGSGSGSGMESGSGPVEAMLAAHREIATPDAAQFGAGEAVRLPDGTSVMAPNPVAASAVRHALTQLGVPYQWGGTTAGVGLDCSGLTQWAYQEAGLNIPRLAQEQDIGSTVDVGALRPGDLAVWDGHVAMIVGNGTMIEAGDPVQLSAIRTTNAGQGFQGFWRPTA